MKKIMIILVSLLFLFGCSAQAATKSYTEEEIKAMIDAKIAELTPGPVVDGTKLTVYPTEAFSWVVTGTSLKVYVESFEATVTNVDFATVSAGTERFYDGNLSDDPGYAPYDVNLVLKGHLDSKYGDYSLAIVIATSNNTLTTYWVDIQADGTFVSDIHAFYYTLPSLTFVQAYIQ